MKKQIELMAASYGRSVVGAVVAVYLTGATNPTDYFKAAVAALIPPIMRWANPNDTAYGRTK
jgi:hypothetical protein